MCAHDPDCPTRARRARDVLTRGRPAWYVYFAQSTNVFKGRWTLTAATPVIHFGGVCEGGVSCTGNRDLYDDFGVAVNPATGFASIVYSDDQYSAAAASSNCTASATNTASCDHTNIATQTGGTGIE